MANRRAPVLDLEELLTYRLAAIYSRLSTSISRQLAQHHGLALREWRVLAMLARHEPLSGSELVARSIMDKASVSRGATALLARKLIVATPHRQDKRAQLLRLTPAGWRLYNDVVPLSRARQAALLAPFDERERRTLFTLLERLERRVFEVLGNSTEGSAGVRKRGV